MLGSSILLCILPHICIYKILPQKVVLLQHMTWGNILEFTEVSWVLIFPDKVKFSFSTLNLHVICKIYSKSHDVYHWKITVFSASIFNATMVNVIVNWMNVWKRTDIDMKGFIHFYTPIVLGISLPPWSENVSCVTLVEFVDRSDGVQGGQLEINFHPLGSFCSDRVEFLSVIICCCLFHHLKNSLSR